MIDLHDITAVNTERDHQVLLSFFHFLFLRLFHFHSKKTKEKKDSNFEEIVDALFLKLLPNLKEDLMTDTTGHTPLTFA